MKRFDSQSIMIDREITTPLLLRCFWKLNAKFGIHDYNTQTEEGEIIYPSQEAQIYTWPDATLNELAEILGESLPQINSNSQIIFSLVWVDRNGNHVIRNIGRVNTNGRGGDGGKTLKGCRFTTGDLLDVQVVS